MAAGYRGKGAEGQAILHFKADGPGWQTRLNDTLAEVVRERKKA